MTIIIVKPVCTFQIQVGCHRKRSSISRMRIHCHSKSKGFNEIDDNQPAIQRNVAVIER